MKSHTEDQRVTPPTNVAVVPSKLNFPIVGIGASAGGLEAVLRFFENMPAANGMSFVIILHLSSSHESTVDSVIQRATSMPVIMVNEPVKIKCEHVYVIAPNKHLTMVDGTLSLADLDRPRGTHIAIDTFFRSLAEVHRERAIAVVLSGTGSDGAVGLTRIKEQGGVTIVQMPSDAEHEGMPLAALRTGVVDFQLPVVDIPQKLIELWDNARVIKLLPFSDGDSAEVDMPEESRESAEAALKAIVTGLRHYLGHDFGHYKRATVLRRIERRMQVRGVPNLIEYSKLLESDTREYEPLLVDMLISVTNFFRDRGAFESLERGIIPELFRNKNAGEVVRVWVAACATGEEAYSIAMLLADHASSMNISPASQVFATDINDEAIAVARSGTFPAAIITDVPPIRLRQHFGKEGDRYRIHKSIRDRILFASHNILRDPPFSRLDLISCRNFLIYLNRDVQAQVLEIFHFALKPGGYLFLGGSESAESVAEYFIPVDKKNRIYRARSFVRPSQFQTQPSGGMRNLSELIARPAQQAKPSYAEIHQRALAGVAPPSIILDSDGNIAHISQDAVRFTRMVAGEPSRNVLALVVPELRLELRSALFQLQQGTTFVTCRAVRVADETEGSLVIMKISPFRETATSEKFVLILFTDQNLETSVQTPPLAAHPDNVLLMKLEAELQRTEEQLQETIEHAEISTEELRASNEELQAINERLRSATEELETSKEELQSVNEELITVNYELKMKVEETGKTNDDLNNLIASTDIATVFVDKALRIKRFTPRAADIFRIISSDIGRSLLDLSHRLDYVQLADDVSTAFENLRLVEREVRSSDGRYYIVRLLPYRTTEDRIDGTVMTFFDISARREAEAQVLAGEARMRMVADSTNDYAIITSDTHGRVVTWNKGAERLFGHREEEMIGKTLEDLFTVEDRMQDVPAQELQRARENGRAEDERWHLRKDGSRVYCSGVTTPLGTAGIYGYAKIARDQTDRVRIESERNEKLHIEQLNRCEAESAVALKDEFLAVMSHELRHPLNIIHINVELLARMPEVAQSVNVARSTTQIKSAVMSQAKIIDDLLDMSRARTGKLNIVLGPVDLNDLVGTVINIAREDINTRHMRIEKYAPASPVMVSADAVRIEQVLMNVLGNAIKFSPAEASITVTITTDNDFARVDIVDTGQGISPTVLPFVFDMFKQSGAVTTRSQNGLGIGLALVREIVELHNGRAEVASEGVGKGTRVSFWLPVSTVIAGQSDVLPAPVNQGWRDLRVLIVDDSTDIVVVLKMLLKSEGMRVTTATSAEAGLEAMQIKTVDLLITDISMPGVDGFQFLKSARALPGYANLPAIALSGLARASDIKKSGEAGFLAHLIKPFPVDQLFDILSTLHTTSRV